MPDREFATSLKYLLGLPLGLHASVPQTAEDLLPCTKCGRGLTMEHSLSCNMNSHGVKTHDDVVKVVMTLAKQAFHTEAGWVSHEPSVASVYPTSTASYPDASRPQYNLLRADFAVLPLEEGGLFADMSINVASCHTYLVSVENYEAPSLSEERAKKLQKAASGLAPVPVSKQERDYLPGTGVYVGDVTTSNWKKEADKVTHYALRCDGFDPSTFYAFTVDTHGAMNPRGRDLIRKLARMAADNAVERGAAPRKWWEIADTAITHISVALQRNNARRILAAHNRCQKEALCHRHPAGALGTPTTVFAAVVEKAQKRRLRPGMVWKDRETPLGSPKARVARNAAGEA